MGRDRVAVFVVFALNGAVLGSWAPRVPAVSEQVHATPGTLGLALLGASVGMLGAAALAGRLIERVGARTAVAMGVVAAAVLLPVIGSATSIGVLALALAGLGASVGTWDVAMNVAAVSVERRAAKPLMPIMHAGFSFGALAGSALAGLAAGVGWTPGKHLMFAAVATLLVLVATVRAVPGVVPPSEAQKAEKPARGSLVKRPLLWLLASIALFSAIAEGANSDWSALLMVTEHGVGEGAAALAYSVFSLAMALARLGGSWLQLRFGATATLVAGAGMACVGLLGAAVIPLAAAGFAGFALAGAGLAAAFPVALSLAGQAGRRADDSGGERELAFVTMIAYSGFLIGPPLIGGIAQVTSLSASFVVFALVAGLIVPSSVLAARSAVRERTEVSARG
jgi:MFS family permease